MKNKTTDLPSNRMTKPYWLEGEKLRRECVVVDGDHVWDFICACADGDNDSVRALLEKDRNLLHAQIWYSKPIDHALRNGHLDVVKTIHEFDVENRLASYINGHHLRCDREELLRRGHDHIVRYLDEEYWPRLVPNHLPEFDAFKRFFDTDGDAEIDVATIIEAVRENSALLNTTDHDGNSAMHLAIENRHLELAKKLVQAGAAVDGNKADGTTLTDLASHRLPEAIPWLLDLGLEPSLHTAVVAGPEDVVRRMVADDPSRLHQMDSEDWSPLNLAVKHRRRDMVKLLLELGADPNYPEGDAPDGGALAAASEMHDIEMMSWLLEAGANPNANVDSSGTVYTFCTNWGQAKSDVAMEALALLRRYGARVDDEEDDEEGDDANHDVQRSLDFLQNASAEEILRVREDGTYLSGIRTAEELDLYVDRVGNGRIIKQPWYEVVKAPSSEKLFRRAIHHGLDVNLGDWLGRTHLHAAAALNDMERATYLLELGADINAVDAHSMTTPLGFAARNGHVQMVKFLLKNGADKRLPVEEGYQWATPAAYAQYQLDHYETRHYKHDSAHWFLTGHRTPASKDELEQIIELVGTTR